MASRWSAAVMRGGGVGRDDPQFGEVRPIARVAKVRELRDGEEVHLGKLAMTAHFTPGHTPGGTSWTWKSCEAGRCLHMVYSDSVTAVSRDGYKFTEHPEVVAEFEKSFAFLDTTPCDVLLTAHPEAADLWERMDGHRKGISPDPLIDASGCRRLAETGRKMLEEREQAERR
jgi:metallo-beta-lactamase class B